jgi:hypothetical protein
VTLDIPALRELAAKATPGPWERESLRQTDTPDRHHEFAVVDPGGRVICDTQNADWTIGEIHTEGPDEDGFCYSWNEPSKRNIGFIAALVNSAPALLSEAASAADLRRENARLREALTNVRECFEAAYAEGLNERLAEEPNRRKFLLL